MPLSTEHLAVLESRRACVRQLHGLGMSQAEIARALEIPGNTVKYNLYVMRIPWHEKRSAADRFARLFERFAVFSTSAELPADQRKLVIDSHPGPYMLKQLAIILENALGLQNVWTRLGEEEVLFKKVISAAAHEPQWRYTLLEAVFGPRHLVRDLYEMRQKYLADVARCHIGVPKSTDAVHDALFARLAETARESMRPDWPKPETVQQTVTAAVDTLTNDERAALDRLYCASLTLEQAAKRMHVTRDKVRQLRDQALRKLRHPSRLRLLAPLWHPVSLSWDATVGVQERFDTICHSMRDLLDSPAVLTIVARHSDGIDADIVNALCRTVDELEFSCRVAACLQNANIKFVWELVPKTEAHLLKTKNLGRKALNEIKDLLAKIPAGRTRLTLGMSPSDPNIAAAMERCPRE